MTVESAAYPEPMDEAFTLTSDDDDLVERGTHIAFNPDIVGSYLQQIGKVPLLNAEQEVELAKRIEVGLYAGRLLTERQADEEQGARRGDEQYWQDLRQLAAEGKAAQDHMMTANLRLVVSIARRYRNRGMEFTDIVQEGNLGLAHAIEKFDYTQSIKFSTYATWWIRQAITRSLAEKSRIIRVPVHMHEKLSKLRRTQLNGLQTLGRNLTPAEIAKEMELSEDKVLELIEYSRVEPSSLNELVSTSTGRRYQETEVGDLIASADTSHSPQEILEKTLLRAELDTILNTMSEKEAGVIRLRFGYGGEKPMTLDEIGKLYGLTREGIRQIELKAMRKLRKPRLSGHLKVFMEDA